MRIVKNSQEGVFLFLFSFPIQGIWTSMGFVCNNTDPDLFLSVTAWYSMDMNIFTRRSAGDGSWYPWDNLRSHSWSVLLFFIILAPKAFGKCCSFWRQKQQRETRPAGVERVEHERLQMFARFSTKKTTLLIDVSSQLSRRSWRTKGVHRRCWQRLHVGAKKQLSRSYNTFGAKKQKQPKS